MRNIRVLICQVDDGTPDLMNELACFNLAAPDVTVPVWPPAHSPSGQSDRPRDRRIVHDTPSPSLAPWPPDG